MRYLFIEVNAVTGKMLFEATPAAKKKHGIKAGVYTPTFEEVIEFSDSLQKFFRKYPDVETHCKGSTRFIQVLLSSRWWCCGR
jgi:hypothetical protein